MPTIARSVLVNVLDCSSDYVKAFTPGVHAKLAVTVGYAETTRIGSFALRTGDTSLSLVDDVIDYGMSTTVVKRGEALVVDVILPRAHSFVESAGSSAVAVQNKVATTVVSVRALPSRTARGAVHRVGQANTAVRFRYNAAKCSVTAAKVPSPPRTVSLYRSLGHLAGGTPQRCVWLHDDHSDSHSDFGSTMPASTSSRLSLNPWSCFHSSMLSPASPIHAFTRFHPLPHSPVPEPPPSLHRGADPHACLTPPPLRV
jgi:hypothetical protein